MEKVVFTIFTCVAITIVTCAGSPRGLSCNGFFCRRENTTFPCMVEGLACCKGRGRNHWSVRQYQPNHVCCSGSGVLYDPSTNVCVNKTIRRKLFDNEEECGSTRTYNPETQDCCKSGDGKNGRVYNKGGACCNDKYISDPDKDCCQGIIYKKSKKTCCPGNESYQLFPIPNGKCCLDVAYDPSVKRCERDERIINKDEQSECGHTYYDNRTHICCNDQVLNSSLYLCYKSRNSVYKLDPNDNEACLTQSGNYVTFNTGLVNRKVCIHRQGIVSLAPDQGLCHDAPRRTYNINTDLCCGGSFHRNGLVDGKKCCENGYNAYNPDIEMCCHNQIGARVSENRGGRCCGKSGYDPRNETCLPSKRIEPAECPDENKPPYSQRCNLTNAQVQNLQSAFHKGGLHVYFGTVAGKPKVQKKSRKWRLVDVEQFVTADQKRKRKPTGKVKVKRASGRITVTARMCSCPYRLQSGERYIFFTANKMKRGKLTLQVKEQPSIKDTDAVISLENPGELGHWLQILFGSSGNS